MDPLARRRTIRLIREWARAGKSIIVSSHILHEIESMTGNILLINNGRILAEGDVHHIRDLIDEHPHTVYVRAADPRRLAREFLAHDDVRSLKFEQDAVVVETGQPDRVLRAVDRHGGDRRVWRDRRDHVARRQPAGGLPVPGQMTNDTSSLSMTNDTPTAQPRPPGFVTSSLRIFDLSIGEMLWSRRTIFMALLVAAPVLIALFVRLLVGLGAPIFEEPRGGGSSIRMTGPAMFGLLIWVVYLRIHRAACWGSSTAPR